MNFPKNVTISESQNRNLQIICNELNIKKSKLISIFIVNYLKYYRTENKETIEQFIIKTRKNISLTIRIKEADYNQVSDAAKNLKVKNSVFFRLAIYRMLEYYKIFGKDILSVEKDIFSILEELKELKELQKYKKLTEKRMKILYEVMIIAGIEFKSEESALFS